MSSECWTIEVGAHFTWFHFAAELPDTADDWQLKQRVICWLLRSQRGADDAEAGAALTTSNNCEYGLARSDGEARVVRLET